MNLPQPATRQSRPVPGAVEALRERIFASPVETRLGSLKGLAQELGVGIVTLQQAARVLEHEGLLEVRRGPGGGYYGVRPDEAALQRALAAYIRAHPVAYAEALDIMTLLFRELVAAAAESDDPLLRAELAAMVPQIDSVRDGPASGVFETRFQNLLFRMVDRPLCALLTQVALHLYDEWPVSPLYGGEQGLAEWRAGRHRVLGAILAGDRALAWFEAGRNRDLLLARMRERTDADEIHGARTG